MRLHCLGTAGYHPNEERHTSCYFLPESGIVLDAGTGFFRVAELIQTPTLDILLSHAHLDHVAGLTFLLNVLHQRPVERVRIWGVKEKLDAIREHLFSKPLFPVPLQAQWCEIDALGQFSLGDCKVTWRPQQHPGMSVGYRLDWACGKSLLYLTDTIGDVSAEASRWYRGADLMMHECYFAAERADWAVKTGHTWTGRVAEIAVAAVPKSLMLTHVNPLDPDPGVMLSEVSARLMGSGIPVSLAEDRGVVELRNHEH
jgi:ribonuclease BN (tRNA processing enzyme)